MVRRCLYLVVNREPSLVTFWNDERLDVPARGLLLRVMDIAFQRHIALPLFDVTLECEAVLPMHSQSGPASARVSDGDGSSWVFGEHIGEILVQAVFVAEDVVFLGDIGVHSLGDGSRIRISLAADGDGLLARTARPRT